MKLFFQGSSSSKSDLLAGASSSSNPPASVDRSGIGGRRSQSPSQEEARRYEMGNYYSCNNTVDESYNRHNIENLSF